MQFLPGRAEEGEITMSYNIVVEIPIYWSEEQQPIKEEILDYLVDSIGLLVSDAEIKSIEKE